MSELAVLWTVYPLVYARLCTHFEGGHHLPPARSVNAVLISGAHVDHVP